MKRGAGIWPYLALVVGGAVSLFAGCAAPYPNALRDSDGNEIRFSDIGPILSNPDLNEDEKKDALRALGITDEELLNLLVAQSV